MNKPIVGITMGDPAGSGPEITIKALADPEQYSYCRPIVVGDVKVMEQAKKFVGREDIVIHRCEKVSDALFTPGTIDVLHLDLIEDISKFEIAKVSVEGGNAAFQCVKKVIELAMAASMAGWISSISSVPNMPFSPQWGFRPATAMRGFSMPISLQALLAISMTSSTRSFLTRSQASRRETWVETCTTRRS